MEDKVIRMTRLDYLDWGSSPILHSEDECNGKYKCYYDMWIGEGYTIEFIE